MKALFYRMNDFFFDVEYEASADGEQAKPVNVDWVGLSLFYGVILLMITLTAGVLLAELN